MWVFASKTLSSSPFLYNPFPNRHSSSSKLKLNSSLSVKFEYETERGLDFETGESFFRHESATGRDLGVLAAALYKKSKARLRILDGLCGCGVRSLRYLVEAEADFVLANDANDDCRDVICRNLSQVPRGSDDEPRWTVTHTDANRVMMEFYLQRDFFDLIDIDSFGSDSSFLRPAINALRYDGLLYVTSTDGYSSGGHRPHHSLAAYGAYVRPLPYSNEIGLRMLIGGAVREASVLGHRVVPLFSYYSYHGPVFRVMLRVNRGKLSDNCHYSFVSYCHQCGNSQTFSFDELSQISCSCGNSKADLQDCFSVLLQTIFHYFNVQRQTMFFIPSFLQRTNKAYKQKRKVY
ncbi:tRNA (guanine(26)-N(2))-dimethyltransferase isoform X2 [Humulus lupulus]|uniref:tRNA (guanine(26)-N(2))-dimethyltransferase isoform X2 n=1 Tax=Humulus lupulus TaxID=3486 RepID=UPI002B40996D|nr:tRNA (guanine(26)-N(2))-dimethyltransferase isoform X2 [Humulus lupulus]